LYAAKLSDGLDMFFATNHFDKLSAAAQNYSTINFPIHWREDD
jgi:hypothetical protein